MRAIRLRHPGGLRGLEWTEEQAPGPGAGEVLVRVRACSLNLRDLFILRGSSPGAFGRVPLSDAAGEVVEVGAGVDDLRAGDAVVSVFYPYWLQGEMTPSTRRDVPGETIDGYARELACMPAQALMRAPPGLSFAESASLPCTAVTAWRGLIVSGRIRPGETVLTLGTGSVSLFALQFAKMAGARVVATSSAAEKLRRLEQLGADEVVDYTAVPEWGRRVRELTGGRGVDHVVEVGGPGTLAQSIAACRTGGHIALIGVLTGFAGELSIPSLFANEIRVSGISIGSRADQEEMIRAIAANRLQPVLDRTFRFEQIADAFEHYEARRHLGKVGIEL